MSLCGSIEDLPLLEILQVVAYCQKTGHLTVHAPKGDAAVVFREGRVVSGYLWDSPDPPVAAEQGQVRRRIAGVLEQLVRLREGEFAFNLTDQVPTRLGERDLSGETLADGINPEELMLDLARKLDEDRRDCTAALDVSYAAAHHEEAAPPDAAPAGDESATAAAAEQVKAGPRPAVLLVDDEADVCQVVGRQLADSGFEVVTAASAGHARREMTRLAAENRRFLLVVDLGLPSETGSSFRGGLDVVRHSSGLPVPPPALLMVETADAQIRGRARRLGVSLMAFKPGLSKLDPLQYQADLRTFADKLARELLPTLAGRRGAHGRPASGTKPAPKVSEPDQPGAVLRNVLAEIEARPDPDRVALALLRAARAFFTRSILFVLKDDELRGVSGYGPSGDDCPLELLARSLSVPLEQPSPFRDVVASGKPWAGVLPAAGALGALLERIGPLASRAAALVPVRASHQTVALIYSDAPDGSELPPVAPFAEFVEQAGRTLETGLVVRRTLRFAPPASMVS